MINKAILLGNLGKDPEVRQFENGIVARFSLATNESRRDKNSGEWQTFTEWHDVTAWGQLGERVGRQLHKGSLVYVEGKITHRKWQDREGRDRYSTEIVAQVIRNLDKRDASRITSEQPAVEEEVPGDAHDDLPF